MRNWARVAIAGLVGTAASALAQPPAAPTAHEVIGLRAPSTGTSALTDAEQIRQALAHYTRAVDARDPIALRRILTPDVVSVGYLREGDQVRATREPTRSAEDLVAGMGRLAQLKPGVRSHHFTHDHIIEIRGDTATMNAQFLVTRSEPAPITPGASGPQGNVRTVLTGYYDDVLRKVDGKWLIAEHRVILDMPYLFTK